MKSDEERLADIILSLDDLKREIESLSEKTGG